MTEVWHQNAEEQEVEEAGEDEGAAVAMTAYTAHLHAPSFIFRCAHPPPVDLIMMM